MKLVIVGGVAGGASAAARARRLSETAEILIVERGPDVSFANCGLPYYVGGTIADRQKLLVATPEFLRKRFRLDVRTRSEVRSIDREQHTVTIADLEEQREYTVPYDKLILAPGAAAIRPPLPGIDLPGIHVLRNLQDMDRIKGNLQEGVHQAVVVGAGFIGLELVENLLELGVETTLVELQNQILPPLDRELTSPLLQELRRRGVKVILGDAVSAFESSPDGLSVQLKSGGSLPAQMAILGIGVRSENQLAVAAGLSVGPRGGIQVDEFLRTSDPDVFAVGDAIETREVVFGQPTQVPLAGPANRQGRIAAENALGGEQKFRGVQCTAILGCCGITAAVTGMGEKLLQQRGVDYRTVTIHPQHHAGYYPGAEQMTLKALFEPQSGRLLGAQGTGGAGVDKRIDVLAVAIQAGMTIYDLEQMELAYAPQFGSAKDPVNMLGFVAAGLLCGDHPQIRAQELSEYLSANQFVVLDVRTPPEFDQAHVPNAINIPVDELRDRLSELSRGTSFVTYCQVGMRGYLATRILLQAGFDVRNLSGGFRSWQQYTYQEFT